MTNRQLQITTATKFVHAQIEEFGEFGCAFVWGFLLFFLLFF